MPPPSPRRGPSGSGCGRSIGPATPGPGPRVRCSPWPLAQGATGYTGTWDTATSTSYSGGLDPVRQHRGASAPYTVTARSIALVTTKAASRGSVRVYVDGVLAATVSTYATTTAYRSIAWQKTWSSAGTHTIRLVVVATAGHPRVDLDAFAYVK